MTQFYQQLTAQSQTDNPYWRSLFQLSKMKLNNVTLLDSTMSWTNWW